MCPSNPLAESSVARPLRHVAFVVISGHSQPTGAKQSIVWIFCSRGLKSCASYNHRISESELLGPEEDMMRRVAARAS
jgi:hypothetical protein